MLQDAMTQTVAKKFANHTVRSASDSITTSVTLVRENPLSDGIIVTAWDNHLCITGGWGSYLFKSSTAKDLTQLFLSPSSNYDYLAEKLVNPDGVLDDDGGITDRFKLACQACAYALEKADS